MCWQPWLHVLVDLPSQRQTSYTNLGDSFGLWCQKLLVHSGLHCFGSEVRQTLMATGAWWIKPLPSLEAGWIPPCSSLGSTHSLAWSPQLLNGSTHVHSRSSHQLYNCCIYFMEIKTLFPFNLGFYCFFPYSILPLVTYDFLFAGLSFVKNKIPKYSMFQEKIQSVWWYSVCSIYPTPYL